MKDMINRVSNLSNTLPDTLATKKFMNKISQAYANKFGAIIFEIVWKTECPVNGLKWSPIGFYNYKASPPDNHESFNARWSEGLFDVCMQNRKPVLVRHLKALIDNDVAFVTEEYSKKPIDRNTYHLGYKETNSELIIPIILRDNFVGLINIESKEADNLTDEITKEIIEIIEPIGHIIEKSELDKERRAQMLDYVEKMKLEEIITEIRNPYCFLARPFGIEFLESENAIRQILNEHNINLETGQSDTSVNSIIDDIIEQIRNCSIGIVDITGLNPNVLMELGIIIGNKKPYFLVRNSNDQEELPFNIKNKQIYTYTYVPNSDQNHQVVFNNDFKTKMNRKVERKVIIK